VYTKFWSEYKSISGMIILKWVLKEWDGRLWTGYIWLMIGPIKTKFRFL